MVLKQKIIFLRGWKSASLEAFAATQAMPKNAKYSPTQHLGAIKGSVILAKNNFKSLTQSHLI